MGTSADPMFMESLLINEDDVFVFISLERVSEGSDQESEKRKHTWILISTKTRYMFATVSTPTVSCWPPPADTQLCTAPLQTDANSRRS